MNILSTSHLSPNHLITYLYVTNYTSDIDYDVFCITYTTCSAPFYPFTILPFYPYLLHHIYSRFVSCTYVFWVFWGKWDISESG